ncbi:MAG: hypothetical protein FWH26_03555 [Oscillospiraceae bacterium]|nr:hypothetical protein [Oscillospiraceae bacterium]
MFRQAKYVISRVRKMDTRRMRAVARELSGKARKPAFWLFMDMVYCGFRYGAGYMDYRLFEFYRRGRAQRATYLTRSRSNALIAKYNRPDRAALVENKLSFCRLYERFLGRGWLDITVAGAEELAAFLAKNPVFFAKTPDGMCGSGVLKITVDHGEPPEALRERMRSSNHTLWEEPIQQHEALTRLCPLAVNTVRVMTLRLGEETHFLKAFLRMSNGREVDNLNAGGFAAPIDLETGVISLPAADKDGLSYETHPVSGEPIVGFQIPFWKECLAMVREAALAEPEVRYLGWDAAITPRGPVLVEANSLPGHDICQLPAHLPDHLGMLPQIEKLERDYELSMR